MTRIEAPRGTHDILPSDQPLWQKVTGEMERLCALYGYHRIQTPVFEDTELFARTAGEGSDVVRSARRVDSRHARSSARKGLRASSVPSVVRGPWPGYTTVSSG